MFAKGIEKLYLCVVKQQTFLRFKTIKKLHKTVKRFLKGDFEQSAKMLAVLNSLTLSQAAHALLSKINLLYFLGN